MMNHRNLCCEKFPCTNEVKNEATFSLACCEVNRMKISIFFGCCCFLILLHVEIQSLFIGKNYIIDTFCARHMVQAALLLSLLPASPNSFLRVRRKGDTYHNSFFGYVNDTSRI